MIPPGLDGSLTEYTSGGNSEWMSFERKKYYTNAFIIQNDKILLGLKKRGFGKDKYNGFGGKVEEGETPAQAALRELEEEAGITAPLEHCGTLLFFSEGAEWAFHIEYYRAGEYNGAIIETEEMRPEWFAIPTESAHLGACSGVQSPKGGDCPSSAIPFDRMWEADSIWFPLLLANRKFTGRVDFGYSEPDEYKLRRWWFGTQ